jgi:hypothetical protein
MAWGRSKTREQEIEAFAAWLDEDIAGVPPKHADEYLLDMLTAPDAGGVGRRVREIIAALPSGTAVSMATIIGIIDQLDRELASERFSAVAVRVRQRLQGAPPAR